MGQVMTIGDALNDLEMIEDAGHGTAMATLAGRAVAAARYLAAPVEEDGSAALIEALVLAPPDEAARNAARLAEAAREHRRRSRAPTRSRLTGGADRRRGRRGSRLSVPAPRILPDGDAARAEAVDLLRAGGIVAVPTDTVYGIAADMALPDAIERLFAAKRRPPEKAVAVLLADAAQAGMLGIVGPAAPRPGRAVLAGRADAGAARPPRRPPAARPGRRRPHHRRPRARPPGARGPSRRSSAPCPRPPPTSPASPTRGMPWRSPPCLGDALALVIDGGPIRGGPASTVVDCTLERPVILREGAIPLEEIVAALEAAGVPHAIEL